MTIEIGNGLSKDFLNTLEASRAFLEKEHHLIRKIGLKTRRLAKGEVVFEVALSEDFADGDALHGGIFTIILDTILAYSVYAELNAMVPMATINLKTDHFAEAAPGTSIFCTAICDGVKNDIAFCTGRATIAATGKLIASAAGTFMINTRPVTSSTRL
jgi:acyl-coenzyme A thioesterase PaaI-like protein